MFQANQTFAQMRNVTGGDDGPLASDGAALIFGAASPDPRDDTRWQHHLGIGLVTFALGTAFGAVWELVEWVSDNGFGSELQEGNGDTVGDLAMDSLGALCAGLLLVLWTTRGWGSVRRVPGTHREAHD